MRFTTIREHGSDSCCYYMTWRTWHHLLLLFTTPGDRACHFCSYLLYLVNKGFIDATIYDGLKPTGLQTFQNHCQRHHIMDVCMFWEPGEISELIAYSNGINDFRRIRNHKKPMYVKGIAMALLTY